MSETINTGEFQNNKSSSGCGKVLLWLFFIALILSCLCCAGLFGVGAYMANAIKKGFVEDPVVAQEKAEESFGEFNLPEYIKPRGIFEAKMFGRDFGYACIYSWRIDAPAAPTELENPEETTEETPTDDEDEIYGMIAFYSLSSEVFSGHDDAFVEGIAKGMVNPENRNLTVKRSETVSVTINGQPADFTFSWMEEKGGVNKSAFLMVSGRFKSIKETPCNVFILLPGEPSLESVTIVLENIQK
ncbi:MAG: hypothetical protein IKX40_10190 [Thermoguttaceae bacterium]|nr:hypothetical protein [Thermoguttaceae bacterium]